LRQANSAERTSGAELGSHEPIASKRRRVAAKQIDLAQIRYFLVAAEHMNYARAAEILGVYRSTLSRQVRHLEDRLGVSLFERHRHGIRLTTAGRQFLARTRQLMYDLQQAFDGAASAGRAEVGSLRLGVGPSILLGPLQAFVAGYRDVLPHVEVRCVESDDPGLIQALHERHVDVVVGYADLLRNTGMRALPLWEEPLYAALSERHPLARLPFMTWSEFERQTVIVRGWTAPPAAYKELARRLPRTMRTLPHLASRETLLGLVGAGLGVSVVPGSVSDVVYPGIVFLPIREPDAKVRVAAAWLDETDNPVKVRFVAGLREFANRETARVSNGARSLSVKPEVPGGRE
jgi:DNA-binding transcriptional LysR family regulator